MKDQYFGDVNDYLKYGILRQLAGHDVVLHVIWMLTHGDASTDGKFTEYLRDSTTWRRHDPSLFDFLRSEVLVRSRRAVEVIEAWEGLTARFVSGIVPDPKADRESWSRTAVQGVHRGSLVFFDPDNGIEVPSRPVGRKGSNKYVYWSELQDAWHRGASLLVYQHFTREKRDDFLRRLGREFQARLGATRLWVLRTPRVAFFVVPQESWADEAWRRSIEIEANWRGRIEVGLLLPGAGGPKEAYV